MISVQSSVEYEYFKDCFTISCATSFKKVTYLAISPEVVATGCDLASPSYDAAESACF